MSFLSGCAEDPQNHSGITIAVSSNFFQTAQELAQIFETESSVSVALVTASTGKLSAQVLQGAPFDVFLSADRAAPKFLAEKKAAIGESQFTYALGRLALYSVDPARLADLTEFPSLEEVDHIAIANPELAPYGRAAREALRYFGHWDKVEANLVRGENISQTWHFVKGGNAELGIVAASQTKNVSEGSVWNIPPTAHSPIEQDAILIHDSPTARRFLAFLASRRARSQIQLDGYDLPALNDAE